ncbi:hypothetical protein OIU77_011315 [Salix suchowensis]|uniref:Uncharacterized protein n=1 Tax=Salix suchowensis TaxID=1278906 RepID=A0ABQ8ZZT2_9ROSI|nr:hypothetical protein OIU77_011315 [Salix suchowensis]KAJ6321185.1 hypothetical protein OIU77_011315 [Salix suchowensis]
MGSFGGTSVCRGSESRSRVVLTVFSLQFPCQDGERVKTFLGEAADECKEFSLRMMYGPRGFLMDSYLWYVELLSAFLGCYFA